METQSPGAALNRQEGPGMDDNIIKFVDVTFLSKDMKKMADFYEHVGFPKVVDDEHRQVFSVDDQDLTLHPEITEDPFGPVSSTFQ